MQDLESALSYMLHIEVATKTIIQGGEYLALRNFIGMLAKVTVTTVQQLPITCDLPPSKESITVAFWWTPIKEKPKDAAKQEPSSLGCPRKCFGCLHFLQ